MKRSSIEDINRRIESRIPKGNPTTCILQMNVNDHLANLVSFLAIAEAKDEYEEWEKRDGDIAYYYHMRNCFRAPTIREVMKDSFRAPTIGDILRVAANRDISEAKEVEISLQECYPKQFQREEDY